MLGRSDRCLRINNCFLEKSEDAVLGVLRDFDVSLLGEYLRWIICVESKIYGSKGVDLEKKSTIVNMPHYSD